MNASILYMYAYEQDRMTSSVAVKNVKRIVKEILIFPRQEIGRTTLNRKTTGYDTT